MKKSTEKAIRTRSLPKKATGIGSLPGRVSQYTSRLDRKSRLYLVGLVLSAALLLLTSVYGGYHASNAYSTDSNAIILTQLFSKNIHYPVILPGPHATLLIIPVVYIQGHLPYHYTSFTLVNVSLVVITMLSWAFLLIKLFGRRYEIPILVILSSLIFTSVTFSISLGYTTIRNIEYPIVLGFVMLVAWLLRATTHSRKQRAVAGVGSLLFIITLAGDSFFNYAILLPLLAVIGWYWVQSQRFTPNMLKALGLIVGSFIGAVLLKKALGAAGIIFFDYGFWGPQTILPTARIWSSLGVALTQTLQMHGANIFGQIINYQGLATFVNFGLLLIGVGSLVAILCQANRSYRSQEELSRGGSFVVVVMALSFFITFVMYVVSGYAIATLPTGQVVSAENARYISLMPLITVIGLVWLLKKYYSKHLALICLLCLVLVAGIITAYPSIQLAYRSGSNNLELAPSRTSIDQTVDILKQNHVTEAQTDYWYGPVLGFWTNKSIAVAPQVGCNASILANPSNSLFTHRPGKNTALIIDRGVLNYGFWQCTDEQLINFYGAPNKHFEVDGTGTNPRVQIWVYQNAP